MSTEYADLTEEVQSPFRIQAVFTCGNETVQEHYLAAAQEMIDKMIPESYWLEIGKELSGEAVQASFFRFSRQVPLLEYSTFADCYGGIAIRLLSQSEFTSGVGRYISDTFSRWLVPGKQLATVGEIGIEFKFQEAPEKRYYFRQEYFAFSHANDLSIALGNIPRLIEEVRLNILAVYHARYIASMRSLSREQRNLIIQENISSLIRTPLHKDRNAYDQMHQFMLKLSEEEKLGQVKKNIAYLLESRPQNFDRDVFSEMTEFTAHFSEHFATIRTSRQISRIIAFHYLFKKLLSLAVQREPNERHLSLKLLKSQLTGSDPVVGILAGMNLIKETERFDKKHLLGAIQMCLPDLVAVPDSFIVDRREEKIKIFYLEVQKPLRQPFTAAEISLLQKELPSLIQRQVENVVHPLFMPRNEEEMLRTIVTLSKQMKFLRDLPHLTIHYEKQTDSEISFHIILVRVMRENDLPFKELLERSGFTQIAVDEIRSAGSMKGKIPKEAAIFRMILDKSEFLRKDYSLDLKRARQKVFASLRQLLGEFRDYNGGMIHKQDEALDQLRKVIGATDNEVLLENFFYSLRPGIMQTVHPPEILHTLYDLCLEAIKVDLPSSGFCLKTILRGKYFFAMIFAASPAFKEEVQTAVSKLKIPSYDLTSTFLLVQKGAAMGYILRTDESEKRAQLEETLRAAMSLFTER